MKGDEGDKQPVSKAHIARPPFRGSRAKAKDRCHIVTKRDNLKGVFICMKGVNEEAI